MDAWYRYFKGANAAERAVLKTLKLLWMMQVRAPGEMIELLGKGVFGLRRMEMDAALNSLKEALWVRKLGEAWACHDVQYAAVELAEADLEALDRFLKGLKGSYKTVMELLVNCSAFLYPGEAARATSEAARRRYLEIAKDDTLRASRLATKKKDQATKAACQNNLSNRYSDLAGLEKDEGKRRQWLQKAVEAVDEAIAIGEECGADRLLVTMAHANGARHHMAWGNYDTKAFARAFDLAVQASDEFRRLGLENDAKEFGAIAAGLAKTHPEMMTAERERG